MKSSLLIGVVIGASLAVAAGSIAGYEAWKSRSQYAEVLNVRPAFKNSKTAREVCHDEQVTRQKPVQDQHKVAGKLIGAVVGGVVGNQFGGGNGKKLATVAGAAAGGYAGNTVQGRMQQGNTETVTEQRCETVHDTVAKQVGYDVQYRLGGKTGEVRMDHDPGKQIPVANGQLLLTDPAQVIVAK
jgi:uncharacterized protein YcfJ